MSAVYAQADDSTVLGELYKLRVALRPSVPQHMPAKSTEHAAETIDSSSSHSGREEECAKRRRDWLQGSRRG